MSALSLPPLFSAEAVSGTGDPVSLACDRAAAGCDAGLVLYRIEAARMAVALVLAPEVPLRRAMAMLPLCGVGFQNALGALAPPEVSIHLEWGGGLRLNGGVVGGLAAWAPLCDDAVPPDWLVIALELTLWPGNYETGNTPERTALYAEGCGEVAPDALVEAWIRHTLLWLNRWEEEGTAPLHREWTGLAHGIGKPVELPGLRGQFVGTDEDFAMLLKTDATTCLIPLTDLLHRPGTAP